MVKIRKKSTVLPALILKTLLTVPSREVLNAGRICLKLQGVNMADNKGAGASRSEILQMASDIVSAYLGNNEVAATEVNDVIEKVYATMATLAGEEVAIGGLDDRPAVPVKRSVTPDYLVCLEDGKKLKMLKRHLRTNYSMTPEEYRAKWKLPADYPMVAPNYAAQRSEFAKKIGLGRRSGKLAH